MSKITKESNILEMLTKYPDVARVLTEHGIHCVGCMAAHFETLEEGAKAHGLSDTEVDELIKEMNRAITEPTDSEARG